MARATLTPARDPAGEPFHFSLGLEVAIAAVIVCTLWRVINHQEARFWAWRSRGRKPTLGVTLKMIGVYLFAAVLTAVLPALTHVFDVRAKSTLGAVFLVAEATAAGLAATTLAGRKATARQDAAEHGDESIAGWAQKALTACFTTLGDDARAGVRERLAEALSSDEHRVKLLSALRDYARDAGEGDGSPIMAVILFVSEWPDRPQDDRDIATGTIRDFVVERRIARQRLIPKNPN